ncbi:MAG: hypothetical protein JO043_11390 [Candidatus Eremiobacteraeota bacterium]|nr:hypothetical protein [Candidatus Eremiobacteraeota bacterium]
MDIRPHASILALLTLLGAGVFAFGAAAPPHERHHARPSHADVDSREPERLIAQADDSEANQDHAKNAGIVEGQVLSVDYQRGTIALLTPDRGKVDVMVLPSTNIQGRGDGFHTIADIARGSRLRVFLSQRAGHFFAQIIHLR